jgi:K+-transporting ATPase ATPase A chain
MGLWDGVQITLFFGVLIGLTPILGTYMAAVFSGRRTVMTPVLGWLEQSIYWISGIDPHQEMNWKEFLKAVLIFNFLGFLVVFGLCVTQGYWGLNPDHLSNTSWPLAFNIAVSFVTNTNWQSYAGEATLSYLTQMVGLGVQNFLSAATGIAVLLVLIRGLKQQLTPNLGNFWVDLVRSIVYILLPLSIIFCVFLMSEGVVQTFSPSAQVQTLEGQKQVIALGPVASQVAIKQLGTNGGGFFNTNSAHPFENPTPLTNFFEMLAILAIPAGLVYAFGCLIENKKHARSVFWVMTLILMGSLSIALWSEFSYPTMEGKEVRFGIVNSVLWSTVTTAASNGSVNSMISSMSPIAGGMALLNIMFGEIIFGGVGSGLYGMILFILLTLFLAGLMVGRTPEYLGKKIESREMKWVIIAILIPNVVILSGAGLACILPAGLSSLAHNGPHGLTEILYAFSSAAGNNGSAFAGLNANTDFYNFALGISMILGRFGVIIPCIAIAGSFSVKKTSPPSTGTFPTEGLLFSVLLISTIFIVGVLTFLPAMTLGPVIEHLLMVSGRKF